MGNPQRLAPQRLQTYQERELKWAIRPGHAQRLEHALLRKWGSGQLLNQHNRFYDSADGLLRSQRMSLRLRRENEQVVLTCKQRKSITNSLHHQQEEECQVNAALWAVLSDADEIDAGCLPIPPVLRRLIGSQPLRNYGGFYNQRRQWSVDGDTVCLDHSRFSPSYTEWEVEIEIGEQQQADERESYWRDYLSALNIELMTQQRSKLQRFIEGPQATAL